MSNVPIGFDKTATWKSFVGIPLLVMELTRNDKLGDDSVWTIAASLNVEAIDEQLLEARL
ncbi:hypothetical protein BY996DRAFT_6511208 [Phakopsora pachyrhizi]|nr:hypothetical protein BY996DRAFT_6511208 [Phakopsora pachyrhizi]